jgi:hypothetical protein
MAQPLRRWPDNGTVPSNQAGTGGWSRETAKVLRTACPLRVTADFDHWTKGSAATQLHNTHTGPGIEEEVLARFAQLLRSVSHQACTRMSGAVAAVPAVRRPRLRVSWPVFEVGLRWAGVCRRPPRFARAQRRAS